MQLEKERAYFLWVGSPLPELARISIRSASFAGFDVTLFSDRAHDLGDKSIQQVDWREVDLPWGPEEVRIPNQDRPYFAGFSNIFRYKLLSGCDGWWFDCDTIICAKAEQFAALRQKHAMILGRAHGDTVNNAVIGSRDRDAMQRLYDAAIGHYPIVERWALTGPDLVTDALKRGSIEVKLMPKTSFYAVDWDEVAKFYLPEFCDELAELHQDSLCVTLWGEGLRASGLKHSAPPAGSYLEKLLSDHPELGTIKGDCDALSYALARHMLAPVDPMKVNGTTALRAIKRAIGRRWRMLLQR